MASDLNVKKSRSAVAISDHYVSSNRRNRSTTGVYALKKSLSSSDLASAFNHDGSYISEKYRPVRYKKYYRDWDLFDDYWWDRRFNTSSLYWPHHCWPNRKYYHQDPPSSLWWNYPSLSWYPKYSRSTYMNNMDPLSWSNYRNPFYDSAVGYSYKPWTMEVNDAGRTVQMYKQNLIDFATVEKNWLVPSHFQRQYDDYNHPHKPSTWYTSPRRYFYTFDSM